MVSPSREPLNGEPLSRISAGAQEAVAPKLLLTPLEAAHCLSIGRTSLYELLRSGRLGSVTIGGSRRIPTSAIMRFVDELAQDALPEPEPPEVTPLRQTLRSRGRRGPTSVGSTQALSLFDNTVPDPDDR
jgi:excisionase family DNA binding protein